MHVETGVAVVGEPRLTCVQPDANTHRRRRELTLRSCGRGDRIRRTLECHEECVALGVDLDAAVAAERGTEHAPVLGERVGVAVAGLVQQPGGSLDVGE